MTRRRQVKRKETGGGEPCEGAEEETESCYISNCSGIL